MNDGPDVPTYAQLLERTDAPPGSSWNVFGDGDQLGTLNFLTPERVLAAREMIRTGKVFNLDYDLYAFDPNMVAARQPVQHHIFQANSNHRDDWIDSFYLQNTSQIDSLRHIAHPKYGLYGGVAPEAVEVGTRDLGISTVAERGIAGRGVLLDAVAYFEKIGSPLDPAGAHYITPEELDAIASFQGTEVRKGDIVLLRTGWSRFVTALSPEERVQLKIAGQPGLDQSHEILAWLWDHNISLVASDNGGVEGGPIRKDTEFYFPPEVDTTHHNGMLHRPLIALLGYFLGELWNLEELAEECARDGVYEFFMTAKPLNLVGGVGSPPNALAIK